jgi:hypothetical protein
LEIVIMLSMQYVKKWIKNNVHHVLKTYHNKKIISIKCDG